jgi:signal transduction histidine kinase
VSAAETSLRLRSRTFHLPKMRLWSLLLAMLLLLATGFIAIATIDRMKASRDLVLHTYEVRGRLKDLRSDIGETHANFDLYLLSRNPDEARDLEKHSEDQIGIFEELRILTKDNPSQLQRLEEFRAVLLEDIVQLRECVGVVNCHESGSSNRPDQLALISARRRIMSAMLLNMENVEAQLLQDRLKVWNRLFKRMIITSILSFSLALGLLLYNLALLIREIERRREMALAEKKNAESYRMLSARILELQDVERRKIARELHDSVGQFLAGLKLNLSRLQHRESESPEQVRQLMTEALDLTDRAIIEVRTISHLLHPPLLDELGFHSAARWYAEGFAKRSGVTIELHLAEVVERLPREIELALFRVLQESLTNIHRHANASTVHIEVHCTDTEVILSVRDNGQGIHRKVLDRFHAGEAGGIGLAGMRERLAELGGLLEVQSAPGGTRVRATLPTRECEPTDIPEEKISITPS